MNPDFYHIPAANHTSDTNFLRLACEQRGVVYSEIMPKDFGVIDALPAGSMLYRSEIGKTVQVFEQYLRAQSPLVTMYSDVRIQAGLLASDVMCEAYDIPMPRTAPILSTDSTHMQAAATAVGGFPLILKLLGGSHGVGVMKIESLASLQSVVDVFLADSEVKLIAREFLHDTTHARMIVLNGQVIDSIEYQAALDEFRTNVGKQPIVTPRKYSAAVEAVAVRAVQVKGVDFGGVDIMFLEDGSPVVLEVNFPCYFTRAQNLTGTDIAGQMVDFLLEKAKNMSKAD